MITRAVLAVFLFLAALAPAMAQRPGTCSVQGSVPGTNARYEGTAEITALSGPTFRVRWQIGDTVTNGFGMRYENWFVIGYTAGNAQGVAFYWLEQSTGVLNGLWSTDGIEGIGVEIMTPR
jgi:hypothetical protein